MPKKEGKTSRSSEGGTEGKKSLEDGEAEEEEVSIRFIIPAGLTEMTVTKTLVNCFCLAQEQGLNPSWIREEEVLNLSPTKTVTFIQGELDVFVLDPFSGPAFDHVSQGDKYKCTVIGPRCLMSCLQAGIAVPNLPYPLYTTAMNGLVITCSGLDKEEKEEMKSLIEKMSGVFSTVFHEGVTHLVSCNVNSKKYEVAVENGTPIMTKAWVQEVWKQSCIDFVSAVDPRFLEFRCPPLLNLTVTVSQLSRTDKDHLKQKIESHGGIYSPELNMNSTNILICITATGSKYQYAQKWKIPCLTPQWVMDSIEKGSALPVQEYKVDRSKNKASTPTKQDQSALGLQEVSMCSTILNPEENVNQSRVDETINTTVNGTVNGTLLNKDQPAAANKKTQEWLQELDLAKVKKSGLFLDNLKVYLSGFDEKDQVQLARVLKFSGATRFTQLVESVTHVISSTHTGYLATETHKIIRDLKLSPYCVSLEWVVRSMQLGRKAAETEFTFPPTSQPNKGGGKGGSTPVKGAEKGEGGEYESQVMAEYQDTTEITQASTQMETFFTGMTFELQGLAEELEHEVSEWISEVGGDIVFSDFTGVVDYLITPTTGGSGKHRHKQHLSHLWVEDCLDSNKLVNVEYYHHPLPQHPNSTPLSSVVTCVSGYNGREREYINCLVSCLGADPQEMFAKRDNKEKGAKASTHLICPAGEGQKYTAALKWGLPIVTKDWLLACLKESLWLCEQPFLVGDSTVYNKDKPLPRVVDTEVEEEEDITKEITVTEAGGGDTTILQELDPNVDSPAPATSSAVRKSVSRSGSRRKSAAREDGGERGGADHTPVTVDRSRKMLIDTPGPDLDTPTLQRLRPKPLHLEAAVTPPHWQDSQPDPSQAPAGSAGNSRKRPLEDDMPTPDQPYGGHLFPNPSPEARKYYKRRVDNLLKLKKEPSKFDMEQMEKWVNFKKEDHPYFKEQEELKAMLSRKRARLDMGAAPVEADFETRMEEKYAKSGKSWKNLELNVGNSARERLKAMEEGVVEEGAAGTESRVLQGVCIYVAKKLVDELTECRRIVHQLGGTVSQELNDSVTHLIFQGKPKDLNKEFRLGLKLGVTIVSPYWLYMCRDENRWAVESVFPHSYNPKMTLDVTETRLGSQMSASEKQNKSRSQQLKRKPPQPVFDDNDSTEKHLEEEEEVEEEQEEEEEEVEKTVQLETPGSGKAEVAKQLKHLQDLVDSVKNSPVPNTSLNTSEKRIRTSLYDENLTPPVCKKKPQEEDKESQVLWVDPTVEEKSRKLAAKLNLETQNFGSMEMESLGSINLSEAMEAASDYPRYFLASGMADDPSLEEAVKGLGGEILDAGVFDPKATHMVAAKVSRSEKLLGSIAAGKWVLHPSYAKDSLAAGAWLKEEDYEWGNAEKGFLDMTNGEGSDVKLAAAARRNRLAHVSGDEGPFSGFRAVLIMPTNKKGPFSRLIEAGGGEVCESLNSSSISSLTHVFSDSKFIPQIQGKLDTLADKGVPVLASLFLNDYLTSEKRLAVDTFIVEEYKNLWEKKKRSRITTDTPTNALKKSKR